jgi:acetate kinase
VPAAARLLLTLNAGSSTLKFAVFDANGTPVRVAAGSVERIGSEVADHAQALEAVLRRIQPQGGLEALAGVGHRIVHGGSALDRPTRVTPQVIAELRRLRPIDPDHLPAEIALVEVLAARAPTLPQVACFDTAFHRSLPRVASLLPIPLEYEARGIRRYGFHGLSYQFLLEELTRLAGEATARGRLVMAHLGSGASLAALLEGRSVDTTMAFTPNSGVPMGTRCGDLDPGLVVHLLREGGLTVDGADEVLSRRSGLLGLSETSSDMRDLVAREGGDARAADAVAVFCYQVRKAIGAMAAALGGLDTLVFAGGIGENAPVIRERVTSGLAHLGVELDPGENRASAPVISPAGSPCTVRVIRTDEEMILARETLRLIGRDQREESQQ